MKSEIEKITQPKTVVLVFKGSKAMPIWHISTPFSIKHIEIKKGEEREVPLIVAKTYLRRYPDAFALKNPGDKLLLDAVITPAEGSPDAKAASGSGKKKDEKDGKKEK